MTSIPDYRSIHSAIPQSTVHPSLSNLASLNEYIENDPSAFVQIIPDLTHHIEQFCLSQPHACLDVWQKLIPVIEYINTQKMLTSLPVLSEKRPESPLCKEVEKTWVNVHGDTWSDPYAWLNDKENPEVLEYIKQENEYSEEMMKSTKPLQKLLYKEFVSRLDESEVSPRTRLSDGYEYYSRKVPGQEYLVHCREMDGVEEIYLDENELANGDLFAEATYFRVNFMKHHVKANLVAIGIDSSGNERNSCLFLRLDTKEFLTDRLEDVYEDFEFSKDGKHCYYTILDSCERAYKFLRHRIGSPVESDIVLFHEEDEMFYLSLTKSCDEEYIILYSYAQITSEAHFLPSNGEESPQVLFPRQDKVQYTIEHHDGYFYVMTNEGVKNNWIYCVKAPNGESWQQIKDARETVIEHRDFVLIESYFLRQNHLILFERSNCLQNVRIVDLRSPGFSTYHYISFSEQVYSLWPGSVDEEVSDLSKTADFDSNILRFTYTSFLQPKQVIDYNMDTRNMTVVSEEKVGGVFQYDPALYASKRLFATGVDGTAVPLSIVYRRDLLGLGMNPSHPNPLLLHGYGAYGSFTHTIFSASRLSLLDRGFIYAVAHIRGSADMGNGWYLDGKLAKKPNTFHDFISCAEYLIKEGYTTPSKLAIYGRSAGGLLIGASINLRPDLFKAALTEVPFVDVINTMFNSSIPWTAFEWEEWGDPNNKSVYDVMKGYCPYTNVDGERLAKGDYPNLLVVAGMNDPRVAFFEPLKLVAKMRGEKKKWEQKLRVKSEKSILLKVEDGGHGGHSGQYSFLEDLAFEYAFLITSLEASMKPIYHGHPSIYGQFDSILSPSVLRNHTSSPISSPLAESMVVDKNEKPRKKKKKEEDGFRRANRGDRQPNKLVCFSQLLILANMFSSNGSRISSRIPHCIMSIYTALFT